MSKFEIYSPYELDLCLRKLNIMKIKLIFSLALIAILMSCTQDLREEFTNSEDKENVQLEKYLTALLNYEAGSDLIDFLDYQKSLHVDHGNAVTRTLKLRSSGDITLDFSPANECEASEVRVNVTGEGNATFLGLFTVNISYCSYDGFNSDYIIYGHQTAANGDIVYGVLVGAGVDPELGEYQDWVFYDGTGRFEGAYGEITLYIVFDYENSTWTNHGVGTLTF